MRVPGIEVGEGLADIEYADIPETFVLELAGDAPQVLDSRHHPDVGAEVGVPRVEGRDDGVVLLVLD